MLIVVDNWPKTGIGHSIPGTATWLAVARQYLSRVVFSYCLPPAVNHSAVTALLNARMYPLCSDHVFDLYDHIRMDAPLKASVADLQAVDAVLRHPTKAQLVDALGSGLVVAAYYPHIRHARALARPHDIHEMLRRIAPITAIPTLPCDVGLHLRTMHVDDASCNVFIDPSCDRGRRARCATAQLEDPRRCHASRPFVTSDHRQMYRQLPLWRSYDEDSTQTWGGSARRRDHEQTIRAWFTLSSCTRAIVSPVPSRFSVAAAARANVSVVACC